MTDSMNFGPDWIRNLSSEGSTGNAGGGTATGVGTKYQPADFRYGREEMLALYDKNSKPPASLTNFKSLYSETALLPLALMPSPEEERGWQGRLPSLSGPPSRGRGGSLERGGRPSRGRGGYQYGRSTIPFEGAVGWSNNGEQTEWSPRREYYQRTSMDNWRRSKNAEDDDGWRNISQGRSGMQEKWGRSTSWRGDLDSEERPLPPPERGGRASWNDPMNRVATTRRSWDNEDHLPEWAMENPTEGGGSFDDKGAFHNSDDELLDGKLSHKRDAGLKKSTSQQHISTKTQPPPLSSSKSSMSLSHTDDTNRKHEGPPIATTEESLPIEDHTPPNERKKSDPNSEKLEKEVVQDMSMLERLPKPLESEKAPIVSNGSFQDNFRNEEQDFEKLQEDFVTKLVVDEEPPKQSTGNYEVGSLPVPPNLVPPPQPVQDKWFYQDPQGQMQGPFTNIEMAEWYKAGYFSHQLKVRRHCDERFFLLGELITMCGGTNPFQSGVSLPILKNDITKMPETDLLQFQYLSQMNAYKQVQARVLADPWSTMMLQQQENAAQRLILQQQVPQEMPFIQQQTPTNPLMHMINQMQQANKLPGQGLVDKPPNMPGTLDPHIQMQLLSLQNRIPASGMTNILPGGLSANMTTGLPPENRSNVPTMQDGITMTSIQNSIPVSIGGNIGISRPNNHSSVEQLNSGQDDPIGSLLKQLQQKQMVEWPQNQFGMPQVHAPPSQWQAHSDVPLTMWDLQKTNKTTEPPSKVQPEFENVKHKAEKEGPKEETKDHKKKKEQDEKQAKKEVEEKRKQEQRKQESEKRAAEEKRKKEEERVRKELEKAKKEAEEKRLRELEEKRRLKDQRKAEEEARRKGEELRKAEEERMRHELKEVEAKRLAEEKRLQQEQIRVAKAAPWSQSNSTLGMSLAEIQKAEKERKAHETALQVQRLQEKELQQQEKVTGIQLNWAKKPVEPRKVKSLAEIQAEEQERLAKLAAETRLQKEKEVPVPVVNNTSSIWNSQSLNWTNSLSNHQSSAGGFWDESSTKKVKKPSTLMKSNSTSSFQPTSANKPQQQPQTNHHQEKIKVKKDDATKTNHNNNNNNGPSTDEFTKWCYKTLSNISTSVDIPTFVTFLRDIESAFDVREYCKEYLGESSVTHQFANNFLEKRRLFKPKSTAHKDDMCSPAPAITPSLQHSTEFQEVKGKNKKNKKSKMLKVDSRILGFNVTSAPDRINVGDRDYGDNS